MMAWYSRARSWIKNRIRSSREVTDSNFADSFVSRTNESAKLESVTSREDLIRFLIQDLAREYQAIISYVVYSQALKGAEYKNIAAEFEKHTQGELTHALTVAKQIDYLDGMPAIHPKEVLPSQKAKEMLLFELENETETI